MTNTSENNFDSQDHAKASGKEEPSRFIQVLPFRLDVALNVPKLFFSLTPWRSVLMTGLFGALVDPPHTQQMVFDFEWPIPYFLTLKPVSKPEKELLHLSRYSTDRLLATGSLLYESVEDGSNPPDFKCKIAQTKIGLDCTQFTIPSRQKVNGLFEKIRGALLKEPRARFTKLRGSTVYMWITEGDEMGLPFRITDETGIQEVISALVNYSVDFERLSIPSEGMPEQLPDLGLKHTIKGCTFYAVPMVGSVPNSQFFNSMGFELGFAYSTRHNREQGWHEIIRLIKKHDKPSINHLLITVGGPNDGGLGFLTEEAYWAFMLEDRTLIESPNYLSKVTVHVWGTGGIFELLPEFQVITPGLYPGGFGLAHHNAIVLDPNAVSSDTGDSPG